MRSSLKSTSPLGFTLIELLIVITVIGILAVIAAPSYILYVKKGYFAEVIQATAPFKLAVESCYATQGSGTSVTGCGNNSNGVPAAAGASGNVGSVIVTSSGVITATGSATHNLSTEVYTLSPIPTNSVLIWNKGGSCVADGLC